MCKQLHLYSLNLKVASWNLQKIISMYINLLSCYLKPANNHIYILCIWKLLTEICKQLYLYGLHLKVTEICQQSYLYYILKLLTEVCKQLYLYTLHLKVAQWNLQTIISTCIAFERCSMKSGNNYVIINIKYIWKLLQTFIPTNITLQSCLIVNIL